MRKLESRSDFEAITAEFGESPLPVQLEDKRMGLCNHWDDEGILVDAYAGNDHETLRIPFSSFYYLGGGLLFAGLRYAEQAA